MRHRCRRDIGIEKSLTLAIFIAAVLGLGFAIGFLNLPGAWYARLNKPWFNPPDWIFGPVWSIIYTLIGFVGWRLWQRDRAGVGLKLWAVQLILNFVWAPVFFTLHWTGTALAIVVVLLIVILLFSATHWALDRVSAIGFLAYGAWVGFATALNSGIWWFN